MSEIKKGDLVLGRKTSDLNLGKFRSSYNRDTGQDLVEGKVFRVREVRTQGYGPSGQVLELDTMDGKRTSYRKWPERFIKL